MELETRCLELQDLVQELQSRPAATAAGAAETPSVPDADAAEQLRAEVARLQTALSNAITAKEAVQVCAAPACAAAAPGVWSVLAALQSCCTSSYGPACMTQA